MPNDGTTQVTVAAGRDRSQINSAATLTNGILVYAINVNEPHRRGALYLADETSTRSWAIPNGVYRFYALAYSGAGMTGSMYCASAGPVSLTGAATTIAFTITTLGVCGFPPFAPSGYSIGPNSLQPFYLGTCAVSAGDMTFLTGSNNCDASGGRPGGTSANSSLKIFLPEYEAFDGVMHFTNGGNTIGSGCINASPTGTAVSIGSREVPVGDVGGDVFLTLLETYSTASCTTLNKKYEFHRGLFASGNNNFSIFRYSNDSIYTPLEPMANVTANGSAVRFFIRDY